MPRASPHSGHACEAELLESAARPEAADAESDEEAALPRCPPALATQAPPSKAFEPGLLGGLEQIELLARPWLEAARHGEAMRRIVVAAE